jgi:NADH dehydrogenase (ubiquinone) 1 alpha/beta subcomplex 1
MYRARQLLVRATQLPRMMGARDLRPAAARYFGGGHGHDHHEHKAHAPGEPYVFLDVEEVSERVVETLKHFSKIDPKKVSRTAHFKKDLGLDSLDAVEVIMALEEEFCIEIPDDIAEKLVSTDLAIKFISEYPMSQ